MKIPEPINTTASLINAYHEAQPNFPRRHLGASLIGQSCSRKVWYTFRWYADAGFDGRMLRLFRRGQMEEETVVKDLEAIGCTVTDRQKRVSFGGFFSGSIDGIVQGLPEAPAKPHLLEIKTHNKKSFDDLEKNGVKKSKPEHYQQMQVYMAGLEIDRALYFAVCKDDDRIYTERVKLDLGVANDLIRKAHDISMSETPPPRISERPDWYECKWCPIHAVCHQGAEPKRSCRSCAFGEPRKDGTWYCRRFCDTIPKDTEPVGCDGWRVRG